MLGCEINMIKFKKDIFSYAITLKQERQSEADLYDYTMESVNA